MPRQEINSDGLQIYFIKMPPHRLEMMDSFEPEYYFNGNQIPFSEPVDAFEHSRNKRLITFVLDSDDRLIRVAVAQRGYSGGTALSQLQLTHIVRTDPIPLPPYAARVPPRFRARALQAISHLGVLPEKASAALLKELIADSDAIKSAVEAANRSSINPISELSEGNQQRIQQERDAAFTAMLIAGFDRDGFIDHAQREGYNPQAWFLDQIIDTRLREDPMLTNDAQIFPGFNMIARHVTGAIRLRQENTLLSILLVNRQPLEELTGSDLIYFNEAHKAFVMVQYKAMESSGENEHVFRLPNAQLAAEISRMREIEAVLAPIHEVANSANFRLNKSPFFLKFCPRMIQQPSEPELVPGMYFPLDHWGELSVSELLQGERGGRLLTHKKTAPTTNAQRYLNNTDFASLVRGGWVGTTANQSSILQLAIEETLRNGRSVTLATTVQIPDPINHQ